MHTAIVILNWNTKDYLRKFIPGILRSVEDMDAELIVADNASTDGSMQMMPEEFPEVRCIPLDRNYGFTGGYNKALGQIEADYYLLLNSDIEVTEGWLEPLVRTLDENPDVGACAPKLHSWQDREMFEYAGAAGGLIDSLGFPFCRGRVMKMLEKDDGQYDAPADVLWATGACLMVRSGIFREIGGFDDRFFAHMEEIDLCWRMQLTGHRVRVVPQSVVYHIGGGTLPSTSPWKLKLNYRNNLMLLENNLARTFALRIFRDTIGRTGKWLGQEVDMASPESRATALSIIAGEAVRKAKSRIFWRMAVDGCAAFAYFITLKYRCFKAVVSAHREYRKLSRGISRLSVIRQLEQHGNAEVHGLYPHWIIPEAIIFRRGIFTRLRRTCQ